MFGQYPRVFLQSVVILIKNGSGKKEEQDETGGGCMYGFVVRGGWVCGLTVCAGAGAKTECVSAQPDCGNRGGDIAKRMHIGAASGADGIIGAAEQGVCGVLRFAG